MLINPIDSNTVGGKPIWILIVKLLLQWCLKTQLYMLCEFCGDKVCREFFGDPNSSSHKVSRS